MPAHSQEAWAMSRRKEIYETLHPETKAGVAGAMAKHCASPENGLASFVESTSRATGKSKKRLYEIAARGRELGEDLQDITGTSLDKVTELDALTKLSPEERKPLIEAAKAGQIVSAKQKAVK